MYDCHISSLLSLRSTFMSDQMPWNISVLICCRVRLTRPTQTLFRSLVGKKSSLSDHLALELWCDSSRCWIQTPWTIILVSLFTEAIFSTSFLMDIRLGRWKDWIFFWREDVLSCFKERVMSSDGVSRHEWHKVEGVSRGVVDAVAKSLKMIHEEVQLSLGRDGWWGRLSAPAECGGEGQVHVEGARRSFPCVECRIVLP